MKRRTLGFQLIPAVAAALLCMTAPAAQAQFQFTYTITNGSVTLTGWYPTCFPGCTTVGPMTIPNTINGLPVTSIGESFSGPFGGFLTSVTVPNGVTSIEAYAFEDDVNLTDITIGSGVTDIENFAFSNCPSLTSVDFEGNAPSFTPAAFALDDNVTGYFLPGTSGWDHLIGCEGCGLTAVMLNPPNPAGSLQVNIVPPAAIASGAQWQVDGGISQPSGATVLGLSVGNHTVSFSTISGWPTPADQTVYVSANSTATTIGSYVAQTPTPTPAPACVVGTGTGASCTEARLNACLPSGGSFSGTVTFNCGGAATITVTTTKTISGDTTIDGGSLITISGGHSVGVFSVNTGVNFTVQNLTIANGNSASGYNGGGIDNEGGTLTVTNSTFSGNSASAGGYGGGIFNYGGTLTVTNSTFSGNSASASGYGGDGGGIANYGGTLTVTNSTFSGNCANYGGYGGGIGGGYGGGIYNYANGTLTVTNSTFSGNCAVGDGYGVGEGGGIYNTGTLTVTDSTFSGNSASAGGGGMYNSGASTVTNTIVANSTSGGNCAGIIGGGHNMDNDGSCLFSGTSLSNTNPMLDPAGLANNGGPTQTIALLAGSPAINAGDELVCSKAPVNNLDQRGYVRPGAGATKCSIGAYEYNSPAPLGPCVGDCSGNGQVTVNEIIVLVNIALGSAEPTACAAGIPSGSQVNVALIIQAVNKALNGCAG